MKNIILSTALLFAVTACQSTPEVKSIPAPVTIEDAVASPYRTEANRVRDAHRRPTETLKFFGLKPEMTVIEVAPGTGWYMEILAPLMMTNGQYIGALPPSDSEYMTKANAKVNDWIATRPEVKAKIRTVTFDPPTEITTAGSADMVLTFRNVHNWMAKGKAQDAFNAFHKVLKPGGILGVVEHRAKAGTKVDPKAKSGYVTEAEVIRMAKKAGFKLAEKSEINANPKDTKNYEGGVWSLPPVLRQGDKDREKFVAIGESDRMTLKFVKK